MIINLKQSAKKWLIENLKNFMVLVNNGKEPILEITIDKCVMEIRLIHIPDFYTRSYKKMNRIPQCQDCPNDGRCQHQDCDDCQSCQENIKQEKE